LGVFGFQILTAGNKTEQPTIVADNHASGKEGTIIASNNNQNDQPPAAFGVQYGADIQFAPEKVEEVQRDGILNNSDALRDLERTQLTIDNEPAFTDSVDGGLPMPNAISQSGTDIDGSRDPQSQSRIGLLPLPSDSDIENAQEIPMRPAFPRASDVMRTPSENAAIAESNDAFPNNPFANQTTQENDAQLSMDSLPSENSIAPSNTQTMAAENVALTRSVETLTKKLETMSSQLQSMENKIAKLEGAVQSAQNRTQTTNTAAAQRQSRPATAARSTQTRSTQPRNTPAKAAPSSRAQASDWRLTGAKPGEAILMHKTRKDTVVVTVGARISGLGRVESIGPVNGRWVVRGTGGTVTQ